MIALRIHMRAMRFTRNIPDFTGLAEPDPRSAEIVLEASPIFWLPSPDRMSTDEAISTILRERYGLAQEARPPDWAISYSLPAEVPIADEISELEQLRRDVELKIGDARGRAVQAGRARLLLYEKGKDVLEPIVRETLRELGVEVQDPVTKGVEDGRLFRGPRRAVLEIKGRTGLITLDDVRQVVQWAGDAKGADGHEYKALILGNPYCEVPPDQRVGVLGPKAEEYARNTNVRVVTTLQVFEALRQKQSGTLDEDGFWQLGFAAAGTADLDQPAIG